MQRLLLSLFLLGVLAPWRSSLSAETPSEEFSIADDLEVRVWAQTPQFFNPTNIDIDARGRVWDLETSGERWAFLDGSPPPPEAASSGATALFAHTNHYVSPELAPGDASRSEGSRLRRERAERLLLDCLGAGSDLVELGRRVLCDQENAPSSICDHWEDDDPDPDQSVTTASMVWEPAEGRAHIAAGQPCASGYATFDL